MKREKKNTEDTTPKKRGKYETKLKVNATLDEVLKVMVSSPYPNLKKRKGNKKQ